MLFSTLDGSARIRPDRRLAFSLKAAPALAVFWLLEDLAVVNQDLHRLSTTLSQFDSVVSHFSFSDDPAPRPSSSALRTP